MNKQNLLFTLCNVSNYYFFCTFFAVKFDSNKKEKAKQKGAKLESVKGKIFRRNNTSSRFHRQRKIEQNLRIF